jgi:hypothetical protein
MTRFEGDHATGTVDGVYLDPDFKIPLLVPEHLAVTRVVAKARIGYGIDTSSWVGRMHFREVQLAVRESVALPMIGDRARLAEIHQIVAEAHLAWVREYEADG